ncbi:MAG: hypothetical protein OXF49_01270 [Candidatus Saccharibacteria bacterium]|nr:hypothetical protein [Candidatus Saccharibacteria bacterium]
MIKNKNTIQSPKDNIEKQYDANGNLIKAGLYDVDGNLEGYDRLEYDANGNEIKTERYDTDGNLEWYNANLETN